MSTSPDAVPTPDRSSPPSNLLSPRAMFRLGLGLIVLAVAWFLKYSFDQGWIGDVAKVTMAAATGIGMIIAGMQIAPRRPGYGNSLQGAGAAILYLTAFATHQRYDLTDTTGAFSMLIGISAAVVGMALRQRSELLAIAGVAGALIAPVIIGGDMAVFPGDAGYYVAVLAVASGLYLRNRWWLLFSLATLGTAVLVGLEGVASWFGSDGGRAEIQIAIAGCWILGWGVAIAGAYRHPDQVITVRMIPIVSTVLIPVGALTATIATWRLEPHTIAWVVISFGLALAHLAAFFAMRGTRPELAAAQFVPITLAATFGWLGSFDGAWIVLAIAVQTSALITIGARHRIQLMAIVGHVMATITGLAWVALLPSAADATWGAEDTVTGLVIVVTAATAWAIKNTTQTESAMAPIYAGITLPGVLVWSLAVLGPLPQGVGLVTGAWAATGFGMLVWGRIQEQNLVRNLGVGVVLLAVAKLLVVDTATTGTPIRIILSASMGLALLAAGYWMAADEDEGESPEPVDKDARALDANEPVSG